jgi:uncharacterized membrane protein YsdA (DUF1294 family)
MYKHHRYQINGILFGLLIMCALIGALLFTTSWSFYWIWLTAINITTFLLFGVDKGLAKSLKNLRIPEIVLHIYTLLGGIVGQAAGRLFFRHKISRDKKRPFDIALVFGILLQIGLVYLWFFR